MVKDTAPQSELPQSELELETAPGTDVALGSRMSDDVLRDINSWEQAIAALRMQFGDEILADIADELGTGFAVADDTTKRQLVGVPMLLVGWTFNLGNWGEFVSMLAITQDGRKVVVNDGSTGIKEQLSEYTARTGKYAGLRVRHGLRESTYDIDAETKIPVTRDFIGATEEAHTFYLDTSA